MKLDPEERVMAKPTEDRVRAVAEALATEEYAEMAWGELPGAEQQRLLKKAAAFIKAHDAAMGESR